MPLPIYISRWCKFANKIIDYRKIALDLYTKLLLYCNMKNTLKNKNWGETFISDYSFPEKLIVILWCGFPYFIWMMCDGLEIWYRVLISVGVWVLMTILCYWFGIFMSSDDRHWN